MSTLGKVILSDGKITNELEFDDSNHIYVYFYSDPGFSQDTSGNDVNYFKIVNQDLTKYSIEESLLRGIDVLSKSLRVVVEIGGIFEKEVFLDELTHKVGIHPEHTGLSEILLGSYEGGH